MRKVVFLLWILVCSTAGVIAQSATEGCIVTVDAKGVRTGTMPLKTTSVKADISGFLARVTVRQEFENRSTTPIEAVYIFPLSQNGAVDRMTMTVGTRTIRGKIMTREDARKTYESAKVEGKSAALLDQERPNIFTQSIANIMPGDGITVEISYVETLKYEDGSYEFVFPMTVAQRYIPGDVKDAARINAPASETRTGHDISIEVNLNAGVPVEEVRSTSHEISQLNLDPARTKVTLKQEKTIPNKDFILRYDVTGKRIEDALLSHRDEHGGFFTLVLQPPDKIGSEDRTPKEIVFVLDTSGSMSGFPIEKAKEAMKLSLEGLYPEDTFNLITFAGDTAILFEDPVPATQANVERAQEFLAGRSGSGGTEMMKAVKAALEPSDSQEHLRVVCFMTDGIVGNDDQIVAEVQKHPNARVFSFGIGQSVNRSLLERIAQEGKGEAEFISLSDDGSRAAKKFYERVRSPLLTDISLDWSGVPVTDVYPTRLTDLFSAKPVIVHGRYTKGMAGSIKLRGKLAGMPWERDIKIDLPEARTENDVLATLWARTRIGQLSADRLKATDSKAGEDLDKQIAALGLEFGMMTNFTSFVAVENRVVNNGGRQETVQVPVERPEDSPFRRMEIIAGLQRPPAVSVGNSITGSQIVALPVQSRDSLSMVTLLPGTASQTVEVTSSPPMIDTTSSTITHTIRLNERRPQAPARSKPAPKSGVGSGYGSGSGNSTGGGLAADTGDVVASQSRQKPPSTPEEKRDALLKAKLHTWLYALTARLAKPELKPAANESLFICDGKAVVRIELSTRSAAVLERLKAAGFELSKEKGKVIVIGRISLDRLAVLAELEDVKLILPFL